MNEGRPKTWDKTKRFYEISYANGKKEIWKDITARECLTKYENINPYGNGLKLREIFATYSLKIRIKVLLFRSKPTLQA